MAKVSRYSMNNESSMGNASTTGDSLGGTLGLSVWCTKDPTKGCDAKLRQEQRKRGAASHGKRCSMGHTCDKCEVHVGQTDDPVLRTHGAGGVKQGQ